MTVEEGKVYLLYYESDDEFERLFGRIGFVGVTRDEVQAQQFVAESPRYKRARYTALDIDEVRFYYCVGVERGNCDIHYVEIDGSSCDGAHEEKIVRQCQCVSFEPIVDDVYVFAANKEEAQSRALELYNKQEKEEIVKADVAQAFAVVRGLVNKSIEMAKEVEERLAKGEKVDDEQE